MKKLLADYFRLWLLIEGEHFDPENEAPDEIIWTRSSTGEYTASSAYKLQFKGSFRSPFSSLIWRKPWAPSKCKFFLWLLLQDCIWTADRLQRREWPNNYCPLCMRNLETANHLFAECPVSTEVWSQVATWTGCEAYKPQGWHGLSTLDWFSAFPTTRQHGKTNTGVRSLAILVIWCLWQERNNRIFDRGERGVNQLVSWIQDEVRSWSTAGAKFLAPLVVFSERE